MEKNMGVGVWAIHILNWRTKQRGVLVKCSPPILNIFDDDAKYVVNKCECYVIALFLSGIISCLLKLKMKELILFASAKSYRLTQPKLLYIEFSASWNLGPCWTILWNWNLSVENACPMVFSLSPRFDLSTSSAICMRPMLCNLFAFTWWRHVLSNGKTVFMRPPSSLTNGRTIEPNYTPICFPTEQRRTKHYPLELRTFYLF